MNEILTNETLKAVRKNKNMTQAEFAKKLGYSETYIQKLEQGKLPITYEFTRNFKHSLDLERAYRECLLCCTLQPIKDIFSSGQNKTWSIPLSELTMP